MNKDAIARVKAQREITIKAARQLCQQMLDDVLDAETVVALARHQAFLDVATGSVDWSQAPQELRAKFIKPATGSDADFQKVLEEARKK